jgi:hypothetical protein
MHFIKTIAAAFALTATVSALPLQKRQDDAAVGNPDSMFLPYLSAFTNNDFFIIATHLSNTIFLFYQCHRREEPNQTNKTSQTP